MSTNDKDVKQVLYQSREKIQVRDVSGMFARLRDIAVWVLMGIYYLSPWIQWGERQAVLLDLPARKFYIFGMVFWPQDFVFLSWLLIIAAITLFYVTSLAGRLWCGYACPQTVWTVVFMKLERFAEGPRNKRLKLDKSPWNKEKILRRGFKHFLWLAFSLWTGFTFVGFFVPIQELATSFMDFSLSGWEAFWVFFYGFATYGNAGFLREQVCLYMCPYARFQSAMFDNDTMIISYDSERGEPRGARKKGSETDAMGACIDCNQCVHVCPTGIDIRDGLQYECIACSGCIDVCDQVMDKMGYERGLIRYTTQHALDGKPSKVIRPRTIVYTVIWFSFIAFFMVALLNRNPLIVDILRDRSVIYRELSGNRIENDYTLKIMNKDQTRHEYKISVKGLDGVEVLTIPKKVSVPPGELLPVAARVIVPRENLNQEEYTIEFHIQTKENAEIEKYEETNFITPVKK